MLEMVKKHTVPETGNWRSICPMVDRTYDMLRMAKDVTRNFVSIPFFVLFDQDADLCDSITNMMQVPPVNQREQVPLGSSSASMYPGYSPADHEYGKAALEYGKAVADARRQGIDLNTSKDPNGPEYVIGQAKGEKRKSSTRMKAEQTGTNGVGSGTGFGADARNANERPQKKAKDVEGQGAGESAQPGNGDNPFFVIDTKPTPVNIDGISHGLHKRASAEPTASEATGEKKSKKAKTKHAESEEETKVELEDITEEVDARLKEKEEKRTRKEEKKRKRESEGSATGVVEISNGVEDSGKPKKKKAKSEEANGDVDGEEKTDKKKKRRKSEGEDCAVDEAAKKKKKRRTTSAD